jgi:hypothetical protein
MNEDDVSKAAGFVSCAEARDILTRFNASHWRGKGGVGETARYTIPADPKRDDDIRMGAFIDRAERMERDIELLARIRAHPAMDSIGIVSDIDSFDVANLLKELLRGGEGA